jgi:hypothetical protein
MNERIASDEGQRGIGYEYELVSITVEYDERADQCTIYPRGLSGMERMSTWLTADRTCFVDLYAIR